MKMRELLIGCVLLGVCAGGARGELPELTITPVGGAALGAGDAGARELSGLSHVGGDEWLAVSDTTGELFRLTIPVDSATGAITAPAVQSGLMLGGAVDLEGVAYDPTTGTAWISDEIGPAIRRHDLTTGAVLQTLTLPAVFANVDTDRSLESLSRNSTTGALWTANEEALTVDGSRSTVAAGTVVRLQKFDASGAPAGQWAYLTDPISGIPGLTLPIRSGVSDLLALPDGRLLVLERELGGTGFLPDYRSAIYLVDFQGATEVSSLAGLIGQAYEPVGKTLLWEGDFQFENYEGIGLGPVLEDGSISLLLVSDDGGDFMQQRIYALRISGVIPEPSGVLPLMGGIMGYALRRRRFVSP